MSPVAFLLVVAVAVAAIAAPLRVVVVVVVVAVVAPLCGCRWRDFPLLNKTIENQ